MKGILRMKYKEFERQNPKALTMGALVAIASVVTMILSSLSVTNAATPTIDMKVTSSNTSVLYSGETIDFELQIRNSGNDLISVSAIASTLSSLTAACQFLINTTLQPGETVQCGSDNVFISGVPAGKFVIETDVEITDINLTKTTFTSTNPIDLWWYGRTPGYWKNHSDDWSTQFAPSDSLQDVFTVPNSLLSDGILDNDSIPGRDTLLSTLTYQGGTTLKGASQILLRAASAALLNEVYFGKNYPGAPSAEYLIARVNVVLASENKAQYLVLAGYFEKWNNGVRIAVAN